MPIPLHKAVGRFLKAHPTIQAPLERLYLWAGKRFWSAEVVGPWEFIPMVADEHRVSRAKQLVREAWRIIAERKEPFPSLTTGHIRRIVLTRSIVDISRHTQTYYTCFTLGEREDPAYLALRLVWIAAFWREWDARALTEVDIPAARRAAYEVQKSFARLLPESEHYLEQIEEIQATDPGL